MTATLSPSVAPASADGRSEAYTDSGCPLDMSRLLIMDFVATLEQEAARTGTLDAGALRAQAEVFLGHLRGLRQPADNCLRLHEQLKWEERRRHPFERLIIRRFAHLLPKRIGDDGVMQGAMLSRRAIPGIAVAITKMIGIDRYRAWETATHEILHRHKAERPGPIDWADVAARRESCQLVELALIRMAPYFGDLDKRVQWLVEVINSHLGPPQPEDGGRVWVMDGPKARMMLLALYDDLRQRLRDGSTELEATYGSRAMGALRELDAAFARIEQQAVMAVQAPARDLPFGGLL